MKINAKVRRFLPTLLILAVAGGAYLWISRLAPTPAVFDESVTIQQASQRAAETGHVVVAVVTADFCSTCQAYKRGALNDERFAQWVQGHAEPVYLEWDRDPEIIKEIGVDRWPATVVMDSTNHVLGKRYGAMGVAELLAFVDLVTPAEGAATSTSTSTSTPTSTSKPVPTPVSAPAASSAG